MNKPPQPITGSTSVPNPSPSPGLTQASYAPGQPQSLVFATQPPPQMTSAPQPRQFAAGPRTLHQQGYYTSRPTMATSAPRVQTSVGPRPVGPHVYPQGSQMMMISQPQLSFPGSPYLIQSSQFRHHYIPTTAQYPVASGNTGFYGGMTPEYNSFEPSLAARERRGGGGRGGGRENGRLSLHGAPLTSQRYPAYYSPQPQYPTSVQPAPVMINPAQQQQQAPPPQQPPAQPQGPPKRERKPITIKDPTRGGQDITEEIMSGGRSTSTPAPSQTNTDGPAQTNGEVLPPVTTVTRRHDNAEHMPCVETTPPAAATPEPVFMAKQDVDSQNVLAMQSDTLSAAPNLTSEAPTQLVEEQENSQTFLPPADTSTSAVDVVQVNTNVGDTVDAPVCPSPSTAQEEEPQATPVPYEKPPEKQKVQEVKGAEENEEQTECAMLEPAAEVPAEAIADTLVAPVDTVAEEMPTKITTEASQPPVLAQEPAALLTQIAASISELEPKPESTPVEPAEPPLSNGLPQDVEELCDDMAFPDTKPCDKPDVFKSQESTPVAKTPLPVEEKEEDVVVENKNKDEENAAKSEDVPPACVSGPTEGCTMQAATFVPKKRRNMKEINKKEAIGDLLDAFTEDQDAKPVSEPSSTQADPVPVAPAEPPAEVVDETWEEKEDKQNAEPDKPEPKSDYNGDKDKHKKELSPDDKKCYDRDFLLRFQFINASLHKPEGLPIINDVVLDKVNKTPLRPADPVRMMNVGPDFTPSYLGNLGSRSVGGLRGPPPGPRRSQQGQRKEPRKIITSMSFSDDVQLNKAEKAWKPSAKKPSRGRDEETAAATTTEEESPEQAETKEILKRLRSILNKLTPQKFQELMKQVGELAIDSEERLKGAIDLIFEKAISEPSFSVAYAKMCHCLLGLKVPVSDKPGATVTFRKLLINRCQKEFEKDQDDDEFLEKKHKEMEASKDEEERERLRVEWVDARDKFRRRSLGNIKFIGELFKLKMLTEAIMRDCVVKLLKNHDEESLECLCRLLSTIGKDLDFEKAKGLMDQYFNQMDKIIKERKTSSRIRFMLQDVLDLRKSNWVPRRGDQGPKTIDQIHKEAEMEERREQFKVQQQLMSKKEAGGGRLGGNMGGRGPHTPGGGRGSQPQDEGWNTVPITKNRTIDTHRLKITQADPTEINNQRLAPLGRSTWGSWGKGSSGGTGAKPSGDQDPGRPATSTVNRYFALQQPSSLSSDSDRRDHQRSSSSRERGGERDKADRDKDRFERFDRDDRSNLSPITKRSFSKETVERGGRGSESRAANESVRRVASMTDSRDRGSRDRASRGSRDRASRGSRDRSSRESRDRASRESRDRASQGSRDRASQGSRDRASQGSRDRASRESRDRASQGSRDRSSRDRGSRDRRPSKDLPVKHESAPAAPTLPKSTLTEEEVEKKSIAIIEEYLHNKDLKDALLCVEELNSTALLFVFVRKGVEFTLERSTSAREHLGTLLHRLIKAGTLPVVQYFQGLLEILEDAEEMAIDIPHIWLYLAELINPMLLEGGIPMGQLFREISKPLVPLGMAGVLLVHILHLQCKGMTPSKVGAMWKVAGLNWSDFLSKNEDVNKFVTDQKVEFTTGEEEKSKDSTKMLLSWEEIRQELDRLLREKASDQSIKDWLEANLNEQQRAANLFVRALMTAVCQLAITGDQYKLDIQQLNLRAKFLQHYLCDEDKELQALYALQALTVDLEQPANLLVMFFKELYQNDVIKDDTFFKWESCKDLAEQSGKGVALKSVMSFLNFLRSAESESDED
ncbi:eukaryotic translation initiation factor 4 gamma 1a isoform X2 [Nerophis ophidion]|uniref:eukaryotic translation initiation factor 4 gamma 1a isoform X2 n=1 Tax=Nerophis ophidion TaxID=159077 RepID=UPI002ADFC582|nr:eukaryotic translation initiation factor 4 gamma 1a isoform X2 [Nerophis ophidion]